jgi:hypothetical protein
MFNRSRPRFGFGHAFGLLGIFVLAGIGAYSVVRMRAARPAKHAKNIHAAKPRARSAARTTTNNHAGRAHAHA